MEYYGNNDYRNYLAHYGRKGMKWHKHLPGVNQNGTNTATSEHEKIAAHRKSENTAFNKIGLTREESRKYYTKEKKNLSRKERNALKAKATFSDIRDGYKLSKEQRRNKNIKKAKQLIYKRLGYRPSRKYE